MRLTVEGKAYDLEREAMNIALIKECRAATGYAPMTLANMFGRGEGDLDVLAAFIWLARRQAGEKVKLADVEQALSYETEVTIEYVTEGTSDADPEAPGGI